MIKYIISVIAFIFISFSMYSQGTSEKLIRKGISLHDKGRYKEAINYYQQALKANPTSISATYEMALTYLHMKEYNNALKYSTQVINANFRPLLVDAYCVKSSALANLNRLDDAIKLLHEGLTRCGNEYLLHYNLGLSYFKKRDNQSAIQHLQKAIELDTTHPGVFLLYAYALNDTDKWLESVMSFHFFLFLEPNTSRSKEAFGEMYDILMTDLPADSPRLQPEDGIDRGAIYNYINSIKRRSEDPEFQFEFFKNASQRIFIQLDQMQNDSRKGLLWDFFVPIYSEILDSGYLNTYCRYISVSYFPTSLEWWNKNTAQVDKFISWFEDGQGSDYAPEDEEEIEDDETE